MRLRELIGNGETGVTLDSPPSLKADDLRICDITEDSRTVMPGSLFIARQGEKSDGRKFVPQAIKAGAVAILTDDPAFTLPAPARSIALLRASDIQLASALLAERFYGNPSSKLLLIGVTGTNGKTTTAFLIHQILNAVGIRCGLIGTVCIDDGTEVAKAELTTPPALELSHTFARMVEAGCRAAVMEVSSHALHQRRVGALRFRAGIFTNLTGDHLDYHGTMDDYADAKAMLFASLPSESEGGVAILNIQDSAHSRMKRDTRAALLRCAIESPLAITTGGGGTAPETICRARVNAVSTGSTSLTLTGPWGTESIALPLVGMFNVMNALEAITAVYGVLRADARSPRPVIVRPHAPHDDPDHVHKPASAHHTETDSAASLLGAHSTDPSSISFPVLAEALAHASPPPGRLEPVTRDGDPLAVFVDYAHTDDALRTVLTTLRESMGGGTPVSARAAAGTSRKLVCIFGCGGDRDKTKRPRMGAVAAELADLIVITSDNPRTENADDIIQEILAGIDAAHRDRVTIEPDRDRAIRAAIRRANASTSRNPAAAGGDVIIIAGKGHEDYQILPDPKRPGQTITRHFDDREVAREALRARGIVPRPAIPLCASHTDHDSAAPAALIDATDLLFESEQM